MKQENHSYETIVLNNQNEVMDFYKKNPSKFRQIYDLFDKELNFGTGSKTKFPVWLKELAAGPKTTFFLITNNKEIIGAIYGYDVVLNKHFELSMIAVKKEYQGKLYGTKLMTKAMSIIFRKGYEKIEMLALEKEKKLLEYLTGNLVDKLGKKRKFNSDFEYKLNKDLVGTHRITKVSKPRRLIAK
ncbi:MAG TPA: GNAT family N-acetyltransferase [archaeon]|jgi:N-acetylglutamate synthase-like GNAT family acetyltransferase|nr:GNAT family N-acetyltransferase [archaeon]